VERSLFFRVVADGVESRRRVHLGRGCWGGFALSVALSLASHFF